MVALDVTTFFSFAHTFAFKSMKVQSKLWLLLKLQAKAISSGRTRTSCLTTRYQCLPDNLSQGKSRILVHETSNGLLEKIMHSLEIHHKRGSSDSPHRVHSAVFDFPCELEEERGLSDSLCRSPVSIHAHPDPQGRRGLTLIHTTLHRNPSPCPPGGTFLQRI